MFAQETDSVSVQTTAAVILDFSLPSAIHHALVTILILKTLLCVHHMETVLLKMYVHVLKDTLEITAIFQFAMELKETTQWCVALMETVSIQTHAYVTMDTQDIAARLLENVLISILQMPTYVPEMVSVLVTTFATVPLVLGEHNVNSHFALEF